MHGGVAGRVLDVGAKYADIRRLTRTHPLFRVAVARGLDADDCLQAVALGLVSRQRTRSAYDPARASFSRYVLLVAGSVLANMLESQRVRERREGLGTESDAALHAGGEVGEDESEIVLRLFAVLVGDGLDARIVLLLIDGQSLAAVRRRRGGQVADTVATRIREELGGRGDGHGCTGDG